MKINLLCHSIKMSLILKYAISALNPSLMPTKPRRILGRKAARAPRKTKEFIADVLANPNDYDDRIRKQAHFMKGLL
jgi:hypothetical protein